MSESIGEYVPIGEIHPHPDNPRVNEYAVDEVAGSIRRFGFSAPIIVRREDSVIIEGHTRWKAAKALKLDSVPVRFMDLNPVDARLLMLASNRIGELAWWDDKKLTSILQELRDEDLSGLGWDENDLVSLMLDKEQGENDPNEEWTGMPEFIQDDLTSFKQLIVHFECQADVDAFASLLGQSLTEKTRSIWYPPQPHMETEAKRY